MAGIRKICLVVASEITVTAFLQRHIEALARQYEVTLVVNTQQSDFAEQHGLPVRLQPMPIERAIRPFSDLRTLFRLVRFFRLQHFDLVHSVTPKAGLLAMLAGRMAGIRYRIHIFTGQVWATRVGFSRLLLKNLDRLLAASATHLLADSASQRQFLIDQEICSPDKLTVLADGSISGVDIDRFRPDQQMRDRIRKQLGLCNEDVLLLFLGRLNRDKGVLDLAEAYEHVADKVKPLHLLFVGPDEAGVKGGIEALTAAAGERVHFVDYTVQPEHYFMAADIFCLPSYREGFGSVVLEAAACGLPSIASRIYGLTDAVVEDETGLMILAGDVDALAAAIQQLAGDQSLRLQMGERARRRACTDFPADRLVQAWLDYYDGLQ